MKKMCMVPPDCCVIIEMERGAILGYRKAVLLNEIQALGSLAKAAKVSKMDQKHARDIIKEMNRSFSQPLVGFLGEADSSDRVELTLKGECTVKAYWQQFEPVWLSIIEERARHY